MKVCENALEIQNGTGGYFGSNANGWKSFLLRPFEFGYVIKIRFFAIIINVSDHDSTGTLLSDNQYPQILIIGFPNQSKKLILRTPCSLPALITTGISEALGKS